VCEAGHGVPLCERGDLAPPSVRHGVGELLHGTTTTPSGRRGAAGVGSCHARWVRVLRGIVHGHGLRERELELGD
jgi:hypothetical protein